MKIFNLWHDGQEDIKMPPVILKSRRIHLRPPSAEDWPHWLSVRRDNKDFLMPFEPSWPPDWDQKEAFYKRLHRQFMAWENGYGRFFLIWRGENELIGGMNINNICRGAAHYASLGYWLSRQAQGQGYMSEAMAAIQAYAFEKLRLNRLHAASLPENKRSINVLNRAGFSEEGYARNYLQINGKWQDHYLFGRCADDWVAQQRQTGNNQFKEILERQS